MIDKTRLVSWVYKTKHVSPFYEKLRATKFTGLKESHMLSLIIINTISCPT